MLNNSRKEFDCDKILCTHCELWITKVLFTVWFISFLFCFLRLPFSRSIRLFYSFRCANRRITYRICAVALQKVNENERNDFASQSIAWSTHSISRGLQYNRIQCISDQSQIWIRYVIGNVRQSNKCSRQSKQKQRIHNAYIPLKRWSNKKILKSRTRATWV